ncbi:MAG: hypothetical protein QNJ90_13330 [Planctomycetota bacterium]|nr:hypothetical protein [Planctomycetota bacterium]
MDVAAAPTTTLPAAPTVPARRSAFTALVLGWLVPGFAQLYVGRPFKALLMFVSIGGLFYAGLALTGYTCVNPQTYSLEFAAHALLGGPTAATYYLTQGIELTDAMPWFEVGRLYAAVAGLLNVVAICDALGEVLEHNRDVRVRATLRQRYLHEREEEQRRALAEAEAREAALLAASAEESALDEALPSPDDATSEEGETV